MSSKPEPRIIQGGMGVAVSGWRLARAVAKTGQLGVVAGTALDTVLLRRLQLGDPGGHMRRALTQFPYQGIADRVLDKYFIHGGKSPDAPFASCGLPSIRPSSEQLGLMVVANFAEVFLAKEGHDGLVGINFLEKIQAPTLPSLYGAMLAGVDYVLMGAGIPLAIPGVLDRLAEGEPVQLSLKVEGGSAGDPLVARFDPAEFTQGEVPWLHRPKFLPIVASSTLATMLVRKSNGRVDGFVVEGPTAGGHNAPPRGKLELNDRGEPMYGQRDVVDIPSIAALGLPFWLAGSYGSPRRVREALQVGATGVQVGTAFAYCDESGLSDDIKRRVLQMARADQLDVFTDPVASPAGFPFKVLRLEGSLSDSAYDDARQRRCDLGYLRQAYRKQDGSIGWRCPAENVTAYVRKGGHAEETRGRKCLCNALLANVGFAQSRRQGERERPLVTAGDEVKHISRFLQGDAATYSARHVVQHLLSDVAVENTAAV